MLVGIIAYAQQAHPGPQQKSGDDCFWVCDDKGVWHCTDGSGGGVATSNDLLLAQCLQTAVTNYTTCMANAPSLIPFLTAYNMGKCEANKTKDICDCHTKYDQ